MGKRGHRIATDVKEQILHRIKNEGVTVAQAAKDHGVSEVTIHSWVAKQTETSVSLSEYLRLKRDNENLLKLVGEMTLRLSETQKKK
jgi:transposase-like protein